jgi:uncharacterized membrane protein (UPF0127 family)
LKISLRAEFIWINLYLVNHNLRVLNKTKHCIIASQAVLADTFFSRLKGLLGKNQLKEQEALIITQCNSIHMFFMKFAIDVIFVDKENHIVGLINEIKPFQLSPIFFKSCYAIEFAAGVIKNTNTQLGDLIELD